MRIFGRKLELWGLRAPFSIDMVIMHVTSSDQRERVDIRQILLTKAGEIVLISKPYPNLAVKS